MYVQGGSQYFMYRTDGRITRDILCIGVKVKQNFINLYL
jgi:hypothetical protein